ncbi:MAG: acyltransferase family protein [bacterium]|jgi:predicted acyltransferase
MTSIKNHERLYSLDALRGFDMFWIMGGAEILHTLHTATGSSTVGQLSHQFSHPAWNGFTAYDLIFPLFLFLAGVATPYSQGRQLAQGKTKNFLLYTVIKRSMTLVLLGVIYNNGLEIIKPISEIRFPSVLGRIGLAYLFASIIYIYSKRTAQIIWFVALIVGYWILLKFTAAPGFSPGDLTMEGNFASYVDRLIIPGRLHQTIHDPEGLFSTIPAVSTGLLGMLIGDMIKNGVQTKIKKAATMGLAGVLFLIVAQIWNLDFPINKNLWTSSFVMQTGGLSLLLLSLFYYIIDVLGYQRWAFLFKIIGMNSILIYMSVKFIDWDHTASSIFGWVGGLVGTPNDVFVLSVSVVFTKLVFLYFLYKQKLFLKV